MSNEPIQKEVGSAAVDVTAARDLIALLSPLVEDIAERSSTSSDDLLPTSSYRNILSTIQSLVPTLTPKSPKFATFHDGQVHDPLGGGSYAFQHDIVEPVLLALVSDEILSNIGKNTSEDRKKDGKDTNPTRFHTQLPTRPIVIHAGVQPNNSPHVGTLVVLCYAFSLARRIRDQMRTKEFSTDHDLPLVSVELTFVDTAPVKGQGVEIDGIQYQRSYRDVPGALNTYMADYIEVLRLLSTWSDIRFTTAFQSDFFSQPTIPSLLRFLIAHHEPLGRQLSPRYGTLALRAACPFQGCGLVEKHGRLNMYHKSRSNQSEDISAIDDATITFSCPYHGPYTICTSEPVQVARLEANAPARNLIRSMSHLLNTSVHHVRITGADYAGMYQEMFLYRPLAAWSAATGLAVGRTPHILYAPLIVDWSGAKLSKSLYVREGGYDAMKLLGADGLCSYVQLKGQFGGDSTEGLKRVWEEVQRWVADPRKLFRTFSVEYLTRVILRNSG